MRTAAMIFLMLVAFWTISTLKTSCTFEMGCSDLSFGIALSLFFGTIVAVPVISYLILADAMAGLARAPWSLLIYAAFVIVGCALYLAAWRYGKGEQLPANAEEWHRFWRGHGPVLIIAAIPFVRRLWQVTSGSR